MFTFPISRSALVWWIMLTLAFLLVGCQAETTGEGKTAVNLNQTLAESPTAEPTATPEPARPTPQRGPDADGDWVSDADEEKFGTDSTKWDTDGDGATDFEEIFIIGSDPVVFEGDSDEDLLRDVTEELVGSDPNTPDEDRDDDGIPDLVELKLGADPGKMDTDGDLLSDFLELYLTETDPASADPVNEYGFPQPLVEWLPEQLQNVECEVAVVFTVDEVAVPDPEEADSGNDINAGDEVYIKYGLWLDVPADFDFRVKESAKDTATWFGKTYQDTRLDRTNFPVLNPLIANCGQTVTLGLQALEDDSPWGGVWDMGTWRDDLHLVFNRLPFGWWHSQQNSFYFYGTTHDSDYHYDFTYSFAVQMLSSITSRADVVAEYEKLVSNSAVQQTALTNEQTAQAMILSWMLLGLLDNSTGSDYQEICIYGIDPATGACYPNDVVAILQNRHAGLTDFGGRQP